MKNLFYSPSENILFWIAGYVAQPDNVHQFIIEITDPANEFADYAQVPFKSIKSMYITESRKYKYMRVYWVEDQTIKVEDVDKFIHNGKEVFNIGTGWTMRKWLC
jgi:hypothetical protein